MVPELRPRGIGEVLDAAVAVYRARFTKLLRVAVAVVVPVNVLTWLILLSARPDSFAIGYTGTATPQFDTAGVQLAATVLVLFVGVLSNALVVAVSTRIVADAYVGRGASTGEALGLARRRFLAIAGVTLFVIVCEVVGLFACFVGSFLPFVFFAVAIPVLILEAASISNAISRSVALTRRHFFHVFGLHVTAQVLASVVAGVFSAAAAGVLHFGGGTVAQVTAQTVATIIASSLTTPFLATAIVVLYFDLRIRDEAFDVQLLLQRSDPHLAA